jgi:hypothetical protein
MSVGRDMEINMECVMYFDSNELEHIFYLYFEFFFKYKCIYKESLSSFVHVVVWLFFYSKI